MNKIIRLIIIVVTLFTVHLSCGPAANEQDPKSVKSSASEPDAESLYQTTGNWDDQYGDTIKLAKLAGKIPILAMVFTRCTFACPRIVADMKAIETKLPAGKKDHVIFVLISFDSDRDHTEYLKGFAEKMKLGDNWLVLHGGDQDVRELSMLLNVKYKKTLNGDFTHSSGISLLDTKGRLIRQREGLAKDPEDFVKAIKLL